MIPSFANGLQGRFWSAEFSVPSHGSSWMCVYALLPRCCMTQSKCHWFLLRQGLVPRPLPQVSTGAHQRPRFARRLVEPDYL